MQTERSILIDECKNCKNEIVIDKVWYPGGVNDYGSFEVECSNCQSVFHIRVGRDVGTSSIKSGAKLIKVKYE